MAQHLCTAHLVVYAKGGRVRGREVGVADCVVLKARVRNRLCACVCVCVVRLYLRRVYVVRDAVCILPEVVHDLDDTGYSVERNRGLREGLLYNDVVRMVTVFYV